MDQTKHLKDVLNKNLSDDLTYERELNDKLKDEVMKFEVEKERLLHKIKEQESISD